MCKTSFIATITPATDDVGETMSTLRYAKNAMEALNISQVRGAPPLLLRDGNVAYVHHAAVSWERFTAGVFAPRALCNRVVLPCVCSVCVQMPVPVVSTAAAVEARRDHDRAPASYQRRSGAGGQGGVRSSRGALLSPPHVASMSTRTAAVRACVCDDGCRQCQVPWLAWTGSTPYLTSLLVASTTCSSIPQRG